MPSQPAWFHRLDEILSALRSMTSTHLDRRAVQKLFRVRQRRQSRANDRLRAPCRSILPPWWTRKHRTARSSDGHRLPQVEVVSRFRYSDLKEASGGRSLHHRKDKAEKRVRQAQAGERYPETATGTQADR